MDAYLKKILDKIKVSNWKTTLIGWVLLLSGLASVLLKMTNWIDATPLLIIGIGFILAEDSKNDKK
jgi:membrane-bound ClpP family serine protease